MNIFSGGEKFILYKKTQNNNYKISKFYLLIIVKFINIISVYLYYQPVAYAVFFG